MSTSDTAPELAPPSVQVITPLPFDPWKPGKLRRSEAIAHANTMLPIHAGHAAGCKVCFCGDFPCPICMYVVPCNSPWRPQDEQPGCIFPIPCCFGVPLIWPVCTGCEQTRGGRGDGDSWIFKGEGGTDLCECIVVDKESGMINVYNQSANDCCMCCTCVPIAKVGQLSVCK